VKSKKTPLSLGVLIGLLCGCGTQQLHRDGLDAASTGNFEEGIAKLEQAAQSNPDNIVYRADLKTERDRAVQQLIGAADNARASGQLEEAEAMYRRVLTIEQRNGRALRGLQAVEADRMHAAQIVKAQQQFDAGQIDNAKALVRDVLAEDPGSAAATALMTRIDAALGPVNVTPHLRTDGDQPVTLQFRDANTDMVFEVLSRQTGINFIFDKDVRPSKTTIFVQRVPIEQAINLILGQNQLARQILSENMVLIYPNTPAKQLEYQDQVVRTFYLTNAEPKAFSDVLKTMLNVKTLIVDERANAVVVRDTPEVIRMAERLMTSLDLPESEVMMEVEVLEITRTKLAELGIQYPGSVAVSPTALAGDPLVAADLRDQDSSTLQISNFPITLNFRKEVGDSNILASPRIRARNHEKASVLIGQRVPVITNSVTPTSTGAAVVTGSVQYVDVGLTLKVEPTIYLDGDVAMKVDLEVSNIIREVPGPQGSLAYQIGTRNASTILRLKDGETQILAGLIQDSERDTSSRLPGLGDIPILGRLFGSHKKDKEKTEIILSITPRVVRAQGRPSSDSIEFRFGTESNLNTAAAAIPVSAGGTRANTASRSFGGTGAQRDAATAADGNAPADRNAAPPPARLSLTWEGPGQVSVGQEFDLTLNVAGGTSLASLRSQLRYDPASLQLLSADLGSVAPAGSSAPNVDERAGRTQLEFASADTPVAGSGSVAVLHFKALSPRPASTIAVQQFAANGADGLAVPVMAPRPFVVVIAP
jgi:general secretion pathway protein D